MAWTDKETFLQIEEWGDEKIQEQLEGCSRNKAVYEKLARAMDASGYSRTAVQCREKIKKLKRDYRNRKDHNGKTGRGRKNWAFFEKMDEILGDRPATTPPVVVDTSAEVLSTIQENIEIEEEGSEASDDIPAESEEDNKDSILRNDENSLPKDLLENVDPKKGKSGTKRSRPT